MIKLSGLFCWLVLAGCSSNLPLKSSLLADQESSPSAGNTPTATTADEGFVGGWAPVFFSSFDKPQLDNIANGLRQQTMKRAVISYPTRMQLLADQIHAYLESASAQTIPLKSIELKDTSQVKYNLTQVIVTVYFNK